MSNHKKLIYLIDGHSMFYRAYHSPQRDLTSPSGEPTKAVYLFTRILLSLLRSHQPDYLAMAVDGDKRDLWRRKFYPGYKRNRGEKPEELRAQMARCYQIAAALGVPLVLSKEWEADDIIATMVANWVDPGREIYMVTRDKDLMALIGPGVQMYDAASDHMIGYMEVVGRYGVLPAHMGDYLSLVGDSTDCIPGVDKCGPKTALKLIKERTALGLVASWHPLTNLMENYEAAGWTSEQLRQARTSQRLVELNQNVNISTRLSNYRWGRPNVKACQPIFEELGFRSMLD